MDAEDIGLCWEFGAVFRRFAIEGTKAGELSPFDAGFGGAPVGGLGAAMTGGFGAELLDDSGSDVYDDSRFAEYILDIYRSLGLVSLPPVSTPPPRFFSFGIPPANMPAS
jgi:hypothetical protein